MATWDLKAEVFLRRYRNDLIIFLHLKIKLEGNSLIFRQMCFGISGDKLRKVFFNWIWNVVTENRESVIHLGKTETSTGELADWLSQMPQRLLKGECLQDRQLFYNLYYLLSKRAVG